MTALALVLTWIAPWSPATWELIDHLLVFIPGSTAILYVAALTIDKRVERLERLHEAGCTQKVRAKTFRAVLSKKSAFSSSLIGSASWASTSAMSN